MSRVLYREYRPTSFDDVKGQDHIVNALKNALKNNSIAHAYLFTGPHGVGKTSVARILAHMINNLEYTGEDEHLDIIEIDAASNRRIDEIRELRDKAFVAPTSSKYKVYIIDEVHMLTREAFNALLKTLEEPPEHAIFILATTEAHKVPRTIISRTQRFSFKPQDTEDLTSRLAYIAKQEDISIEDKAITLLARNANRSFRDAIGLLDQVRYIAGSSKKTITESEVAQVTGIPSSELLDSLIQSLRKSDASLLFSTTEELRKQGVSAAVVNRELSSSLRKLVGEGNLTSNSVAVMRLLLEHMNTATYDTIEVALLSSMELSSSQSDSPRSEQRKNDSADIVKEEKANADNKIAQQPIVNEETTEQAETINENEIKSKNINTLKSKSTENPGDFTWQDILGALKGHHNTLYGILKMSQVTIDSTTITLTFRFGFHEKQFLQTKHQTILKQILKDKSGSDFTVKTLVKKSATEPKITEQPEQEVTQPNQNEDITNISNIFSGAELLE